MIPKLGMNFPTGVILPFERGNWVLRKKLKKYRKGINECCKTGTGCISTAWYSWLNFICSKMLPQKVPNSSRNNLVKTSSVSLITRREISWKLQKGMWSWEKHPPPNVNTANLVLFITHQITNCGVPTKIFLYWKIITLPRNIIKRWHLIVLSRVSAVLLKILPFTGFGDPKVFQRWNIHLTGSAYVTGTLTSVCLWEPSLVSPDLS